MSEISADDWDKCVPADEPLLFHRHLRILETSGIATPENGFIPCHVVLRDENDQILAAAPTYLKSTSKGELGVDFGLELAHNRAVGSYYPKIQVEVPMVPFAGQRLLVRPGVNRQSAVAALLEALRSLAKEKNASSVQIAHMTDHCDLASQHFDISRSSRFLWQAENDNSFDDFLGRMRSRRRSAILRERRHVVQNGLKFKEIAPESLSVDTARQFFSRYRDNFERHRTSLFLSQIYFEQVFEHMQDCIDILVSHDDQGLNGMHFSFIAGRSGYSLYWGLARPVRFLHFEQTYYRGIERAFELGLDQVDFGATGAHKAERGLKATPVYHALWFRDEEFREISKLSCERKTKDGDKQREDELTKLPFKTVD